MAWRMFTKDAVYSVPFNSDARRLKAKAECAAYLIDHLHPLWQVIERLFLGDVIHEYDPLGTSVIG